MKYFFLGLVLGGAICWLAREGAQLHERQTKEIARLMAENSRLKLNQRQVQCKNIEVTEK